MTTIETVITIAMIVLGTMITRFLPFIVFPQDRPVPKYIRYLGRMLPSAALGLLVIYCFKDVNFTGATHGLPEMISVAAVVLLHLLKRQMLISIAGGTILYMLLIQFIF